MAKDPAFLFYPGDWLGGTMTFDRPHKGAYMDLLMGQFNNGHLSLDDIRVILGIDFDNMWESKLKSKFKIDENGCYYNEKLENEMIKRRNFTASRKKNLSHKEAHMESHMENHMEAHMENENENINKDIIKNKRKQFLEPNFDDIKLYCQERKNKIDAQYFIDYQTARDWKLKGGQKIKDWKAVIRTWEKNNFNPVGQNNKTVNQDSGFKPCLRCGKIRYKDDLDDNGNCFTDCGVKK